MSRSARTGYLLNCSKGSNIDYMYGFADHWYAQGGGYQNVTDLILHSTIHNYSLPFHPEAEAAHSRGKHFVMGETNSGG